MIYIRNTNEKISISLRIYSACACCSSAVICLYQRYLINRLISDSLNLDSKGRYLLLIENGSNLKRVNHMLSRHEIINYPQLVTAWARFSKKDQIQAGDYWITELDTPITLINKFVDGDVAQYSVTFPEGWSFKQWISKLADIPQFSFIKQMNQDELLAKIDFDLDHPEGWFFPDTYYFGSNDNVFSILKQAHNRMRAELDNTWKLRDKNLTYTSPYEALIMASIIEKENGQASERRTIACVFVRRLEQGMRLQIQLLFMVWEIVIRVIFVEMIEGVTAYNTDKIDGLPPTPIAMPGLASLEAAVHPKSGSSLFFVARGDGSHHFSDTMTEHVNAVKKYQIEHRVEDYQSSPQ